MNKVDKNRPVSSIIITSMRIILTICQKKTQKQSDSNCKNMKDDSEKIVQSPEQIADHLRVTYVPTYLLAAAVT